MMGLLPASWGIDQVHGAGSLSVLHVCEDYSEQLPFWYQHYFEKHEGSRGFLQPQACSACVLPVRALAGARRDILAVRRHLWPVACSRTASCPSSPGQPARAVRVYAGIRLGVFSSRRAGLSTLQRRNHPGVSDVMGWGRFLALGEFEKLPVIQGRESGCKITWHLKIRCISIFFNI